MEGDATDKDMDDHRLEIQQCQQALLVGILNFSLFKIHFVEHILINTENLFLFFNRGLVMYYFKKECT